MRQLEPGVRYDGNLSNLAVGTARHLNANSTALQFPLRQHPGTGYKAVCRTEQVCRNHDVNCSKPMNHEWAVLRRPPLLRRPEVRLNREAKLLQIRATFWPEGKHMGCLAVTWHRQCAEAQHVVFINEN